MKEYEEGGGNMKTLKTGKKGKKNKITDTYFDTIKNIVSLLVMVVLIILNSGLNWWTLHNIENSDEVRSGLTFQEGHLIMLMNTKMV